MGENICKWSYRQGINLQNVQAAHVPQYQKKKKKKPKQKMGGRPKKTFLQRRYSMATKYMTRCSTSLIIREVQIKTTMRYHLTLARMAIFKKIYKQ